MIRGLDIRRNIDEMWFINMEKNKGNLTEADKIVTGREAKSSQHDRNRYGKQN